MQRRCRRHQFDLGQEDPLRRKLAADSVVDVPKNPGQGSLGGLMGLPKLVGTEQHTDVLEDQKEAHCSWNTARGKKRWVGVE